MIRRVVAVALLALAVTSCTAPATTAPPAPQTSAAAFAPLPAAVSLPRFDVSSSLIRTGLDALGAPEVPPVTEPMQASWWGDSPPPGQPGAAVLLGHVDGQIGGLAGQPGIFHRIHELRPGDEVIVDRVAADPVVFVVERVKTWPKAAFTAGRDGEPTEATHEVYDSTGITRQELRLVTCGGPFDRAARSYRDQIVVFAVAKGA